MKNLKHLAVLLPHCCFRRRPSDGGTDFTGDYKEFDYYVSYSVAGFTFAVWDIFNYSPELPFSKDIFNYNKYSTSHFLDFTWPTTSTRS